MDAGGTDLIFKFLVGGGIVILIFALAGGIIIGKII
jgi:hypothetical protein